MNRPEVYPVKTTILTPPKTIKKPKHIYRRGNLIALDETGIWQIRCGWIQLSAISVTGEERVLGWFGSSMWLSNWLIHSPAYQAKALSDVELQWYSRTEIETSSELFQSLIPHMWQQLKQIEFLVTILKHKRVEDRLHHLLKFLRREMGHSVEGGIRLPMRLTHEDLANAIGSCRITVTRLLGKLKLQKLICFDRAGHIIFQHEVWEERSSVAPGVRSDGLSRVPLWSGWGLKPDDRTFLS